ncbi:MAG: restriction endonuclease subunit S [Clostridia bacterium]|nr:restriction endonuclease subunit S [Clostridia bacterium]
MNKVLLKDVAIEYKQTIKEKSEDISIVGLEHLEPENILLENWDVGKENTFTKGFKKGHVLFGRRRAYLKKAALAQCEGVCSGDITVIEAKEDKIDPKLLPFIIQNESLFDYAVKNSAGSLSPRVKWEHLQNYEFMLPEMTKQKEISDILWSMENTKRSYEKMKNSLDDLIKSQFIEMVNNVKHEVVLLGDLEDSGRITLGRGQVISKTDIMDNKGDYPVYSSSATNNGEIGRYDKFMFDDEKITWSIDGGGKFFYRPPHKYSVTNVCGWLKVNDSNISTKYLYHALMNEWFNKVYDYLHKAHPSVIRKEYTISIPSLEDQRQFVNFIELLDKSKFEIEQALENLKKSQNPY